ncbi:hypothetical protein F4677DRAFT_463619 [Hypoxylon crocopeplum]|nr:hypothetical protein F4677DRAFT_463619 [Hypoxylon crocopeplum]
MTDDEASSSKVDPNGEPLTENEGWKTSDQAKIVSCDIIDIYNRDIPFFIRADLENVAKQLDSHKEGTLEDDTLHLTNLKGEDVEIILNPTVPSVWKDTRCDHGDRREGPYIYYRSIQKTIDYLDMESFDRQSAYLPFAVLYPSPTRHTHYSDVPPTISIRRLNKVLGKKRKSWEACEQYSHLKGLLKSNEILLRNVNKVVAFACGTMVDGSEIKRDNVTQHAFILSVQKILLKMKGRVARSFLPPFLSKGKSADIGVRCISQDPAYWPLDKQVLFGAGVHVLEDPVAFLEVDHNSIVVSIDANAPIQQIIADLGRPAAIIWQKLVEGVNTPNTAKAREWGDPSSTRVQKMLDNEYTKLELKNHVALKNIILYIRRDIK